MLCVDEFGMQSSSEDMAVMLSHVTTVLNHMTSKRVQHLFLMKGSQRLIEACRDCRSVLISKVSWNPGVLITIRLPSDTFFFPKCPDNIW